MPRLLNITDRAAPPAPGFDQPFEMLDACHDKIRQMLALLARMREHLAQHGNDAQARAAAQDVMRYFDVAAPHHHLDEERHVLPALEASADEKLASLARRLRREHREMEQGWAAARPVLARIAQREPASLTAEEDQTLSSFTALYAGHIAAEEELAFPTARSSAGEAELSAMASDMKARRGVK